ncbi:hypothetical protein Tco_0403378 [Tanacetum coccineum]
MSSTSAHQEVLADAGSETRIVMLERGSLYQRTEIPATDTQDARTQTKDDLTDMWNRVKRLMHGTDLSETERESHFVNEFDKFIVEPGESLSSMYNRSSQLNNDMDRNIVKPEVNNLVFLGVQLSSAGSDLGVQFCEVVVSYGYQKLLVTDEMLEYVFAKYGNKWNLEDDLAYVIFEYLWMKYEKDDRGKGGKAGRAYQLKVNKDYKEKGKVHDLDLENRKKKLEVDFGRMLKEMKAKEAKQVEHDQLKENKELIQISSDEDVSSDEGVLSDGGLILFNDVKYPLTDAEIMMFKEIPKRSKAPTRQVAFTSTSNAQAASTLAPRGYRKLAMTGCVHGLRAPNDPNAPTSAPRKRKSKKP